MLIISSKTVSVKALLTELQNQKKTILESPYSYRSNEGGLLNSAMDSIETINWVKWRISGYDRISSKFFEELIEILRENHVHISVRYIYEQPLGKCMSKKKLEDLFNRVFE